MESIEQSLSQYLFKERDMVYAVLDGASIPDLRMKLYEHKPEYVCLYRGELDPDIEEIAPYLVSLRPDAEFTDWVVSQGWGKHWGIFIFCLLPLAEMRRHLRFFLTVYDTDSKPLLFRFYDPRVLRVYLPNCNTEELKTFFGPIEAYALEDKSEDTILDFHLKEGMLQEQKITISQTTNAVPKSAR